MNSAHFSGRTANHTQGIADLARTHDGRELFYLVAAMDDLRKASIELPDIPTTVISGVLYDSGMSTQMRVAVNAAHEYRATRSRRGRHVLATRSGHLISLTEPNVIASEVRRLALLGDWPEVQCRS